MESDDQNIIKVKAKKGFKIASFFIIIMILLINNSFFKGYATTEVDTVNYKINKNLNIIDTLKREVLIALKMKLNGYAITIEDDIFGYVESQEEKDEILKQVYPDNNSKVLWSAEN